MHYLLLLLVVIFIGTPAQSQRIQRLNPLEIGNKMPELVLGRDNNSGKLITTKDLRGKLVIFDFWNIWCSACISAMPKMEALQKEFGSKLQILLVTKNSFKQGEVLFTKLKKQRPNLPMLYEDTVLNNLFPHEAEPLHVWMNPDGRIAYITEAHNTTANNISATLKGKELPFAYRKEILDLDISSSLLNETKRLKNYIYAYSLLMKGLYNVVNDNRIIFKKDSTDGKVVKIQANNSSILQLYAIAFNQKLFGFESELYYNPKNNRMLFASEAARDLIYPETDSLIDAWQERNGVSYEITLPADSKDNIFKSMQQELNRYFKIEGRIEKRPMNVYAIIKTSTPNTQIPFSAQQKPALSHSNSKLSSVNLPIRQSLYSKLVEANYRLDKPIVDDTGYLSSVDLKLHCNLRDLRLVSQELRRYGLDLVEKESMIDVLVFSSK